MNPMGSQVLLLRHGKTERRAVPITTGENRPRYGQTLSLDIDGQQVRAKIVAVWQPSGAAESGNYTYMINADEID